MPVREASRHTWAAGDGRMVQNGVKGGNKSSGTPLPEAIAELGVALAEVRLDRRLSFPSSSSLASAPTPSRVSCEPAEAMGLVCVLLQSAPTAC